MDAYHFTVPLVRALAALGVRHAAITPGSRSTPLALPLAAEQCITDWSHHDERSAGFFAVGAGAATAVPALAACTSGTAAAELFPAVVEARHARVPMIVVTADRPARLVGTGAPQTIDQTDLYGGAALLSVDVDSADPGEGPGALAGRLWKAARRGGPVHLNLRFEEPLVPGSVTPEQADPPIPSPAAAQPAADPGDAEALAGFVAGKAGVLVVGPNRDPDLPDAVAGLAASLGWPILADPLSGLRAGGHDRSRVITAADLLSGAGWLDRSPPEVVVRVGALPTSKPLWRWLEDHPAVPQVLVDPPGTGDPLHAATHEIHAPAALLLAALARSAPEPAPPGWADGWLHAGRVAADAAAAAMPGFPCEPAVAAAVAAGLPGGATLWVASSMPVRDVDMTFPSTERSIRVLANRGANGIDGMISTALGSLAAGGGHTVLLAGDLSVLHDVGALATAARLALPIVIVTVNNDGGGIFHFLSQAEGDPDVFERHFGTPHGLDLTAVAAAFGVRALSATSLEDVQAAVGSQPDGPLLVEVRSERRANVAHHQLVRDAVKTALDSL